MLSSKQICALIVGLGSLHVASAAPALESRSVPEPFPEVIPGEGFPSLESLNLTSEYLYSLPKPESVELEMSIMADPRCGGNYTPVSGAIACFHYLNSLGTQQCGVPISQRSIVMCSSGNSQITGHGIGHSSWCQHVALGALWSIDHCTRPQGDVAGIAPAYGNGDLMVSVGQ
ncbi:hypothetical protein BKA66DRAFT_440428 [Pyrenochaeta sp. MPI-SDFR-AT-0127]|nr:hypothetical protein BKA66DRAFT_440428 [Pyrenochaeta sp. MPI-SDFR-AT-0127]